MAEAGAELVLVPSCTERVSGYHRVRTGSRARALENQIADRAEPDRGRRAVVAGRRPQHRRGRHLRALRADGLGRPAFWPRATLNASQWVAADGRPRAPAPPALVRRDAQLHRLGRTSRARRSSPTRSRSSPSSSRYFSAQVMVTLASSVSVPRSMGTASAFIARAITIGRGPSPPPSTIVSTSPTSAPAAAA